METESKHENTLFPVFLKLEEFKVLLVGGHDVALEKLTALLLNSPATRITVVAISLSDAVKALAATSPSVQIIERAYRDEDLDGHDVVIVATGIREMGEDISRKARERNRWVNVADTPDLCDFYLGSVVRKGHLKIAISTNGKSPTLAKRLREEFERSLPEELDASIRNMAKIRSHLKGNFRQKVKRLNKVTEMLAEDDPKRRERKLKRIASYSLLAFAMMLVGHFVLSYVPWRDLLSGASQWSATIDREFLVMTLAGFAAQLVDGSLGMGYGLISATILLSTGINLAAISGSIHTAEMFASGASGYSHYKFGNVDKKLFRRMVIPGVIGAVLGALALTLFGDTYAAFVKPMLAVYILMLAAKYIILAFRNNHVKREVRHVGRLAGAGGFLDSFGGGGWGPLVTSTLLRNTDDPRKIIGSVSLTEFFVTLASAFTFFTMIGVNHWKVIIALIIGGLVAAPIGARLAGKLKPRASFLLIGLIAAAWSSRILWKTLA